MSTLIQQAIYGEEAGAHTLIAKSSAENSPFRELTFRTDRPGEPPANIRWEPYLSGFAFEDHYVLAKTFPDTSASRAGMVLTHALILPLSAARAVGDLAPLVRLLPATGGRHRAVAPLPFPFPLPGPAPSPETRPPGLAAVVRTLLDRRSGDWPVVWLGQDGFAELVVALWSRLWPETRQNFGFRLSFGPQDVEGQALTLVVTPETLESRWGAHPIVRRTDAQEPSTKAEAFLLGRPEGQPLHEIIRQLGVPPHRLADLRKLERCADYLRKIPDQTGTDETRLVARLLGELAPAADEGVAIKRTVLDRLAQLTASGTPTDIKALRNFDDRPFRDGEGIIGGAITAWIDAQARDGATATRPTSSSGTETYASERAAAIYRVTASGTVGSCSGRNAPRAKGSASAKV